MPLYIDVIFCAERSLFARPLIGIYTLHSSAATIEIPIVSTSILRVTESCPTEITTSTKGKYLLSSSVMFTLCKPDDLSSFSVTSCSKRSKVSPLNLSCTFTLALLPASSSGR